MKIAFRIVVIFRLYPSSNVMSFPESNLFGQHLHNSMYVIVYPLIAYLKHYIGESFYVHSQNFTCGFIFHSIIDS